MFDTWPHKKNSGTVRSVKVALWRFLSIKEHMEAVSLARLPLFSTCFYSDSSKPISGTFLIFSRRNSNECELIYSEMVSLLGRSDEVS